MSKQTYRNAGRSAYVFGALRDMFEDFFDEVENNGQQYDGCGVLIDHLDFMEKH